MTSPIDAAIEQLFRAYEDGYNLALLFDYDGTLTPIVEHPDLARLCEGTVELLGRLAARPRIGLGVISGRMLDELKALITIPKVCLAGTSGLEIDLCGLRISHPRASEGMDLISELAHILQQHLQKFSGAWLENKRLGLTVHYRAVSPEARGRLESTVSEVLNPLRNQLHVVQGPLALEITPDLGWSKSTAVRLMTQSFAAPGCGVFYAGDGANDAEAFETVASSGGVAVGVGPQASQLAEYHVPDPEALLGILTTLDRGLDFRQRQ
jgi:trehalose 6-phosphate phosphatase